MKKILLLTLALLLACAADAQVVRSGSRQKQVRIKAPKEKKDHSLDPNAIGINLGPRRTFPAGTKWVSAGASTTSAKSATATGWTFSSV